MQSNNFGDFEAKMGKVLKCVGEWDKYVLEYDNKRSINNNINKKRKQKKYLKKKIPETIALFYNIFFRNNFVTFY